MIVHGNAKLGPAGRLALTQAIADGMTQEAAAAPSAWRPRRRTGGGIGDLRRVRLSSAPARGCWIDRAVLIEACGCWTPALSTGSAKPGNGPAGGRGWSRERPAIRTRLSGRCSSVMGSHAVRDRGVRMHAGTSGRVPVSCCTWTRRATRGSSGLDIT
jgi:hypothetical protein